MSLETLITSLETLITSLETLIKRLEILIKSKEFLIIPAAYLIIWMKKRTMPLNHSRLKNSDFYSIPPAVGGHKWCNFQILYIQLIAEVGVLIAVVPFIATNSPITTHHSPKIPRGSLRDRKPETNSQPYRKFLAGKFRTFRNKIQVFRRKYFTFFFITTHIVPTL